jgi:hypothetical protein
MKNLVLILAFCAFIGTAAKANTSHTIVTKSDTVRKQKKTSQPHIVHGRQARMRLQMRQIKYHEKQIKKVDSVQKELDKETHKSN